MSAMIENAMDLFHGLEIADLVMRFEVLMHSYETRPNEAKRDLSDLFALNPSMLIGAAYRWITNPESKDSAASQYIARMTIEEGYLLPLLADSDAFPYEEAMLLAESWVRVSPGLGCNLLEKILGQDKGMKVPPGLFRVLEIVSRADGVGRTNALLVRFLRSPNPKVRSRVVELLVRTTRNTETAVALLSDSDDRVRANTIEGLWPQAETRHAQQIFRLNARSPVPRVAVNSLVGLCLAGDADGFSQLIQALRVPNAAMQRAAAWAMGYLGNAEFEGPLRELVLSGNPPHRGHILRALVKIKQRQSATEDSADATINDMAPIERALREGLKSWTQWRHHAKDPQPELEGADLRNLDLTGIDLSFCRLRNTNLSRARLGLCSLFGADLRDANLEGARLSRADLRCAEINHGTRFTNAAFHGASLHGLSLDLAETTGARFE